MEPKHAKADKTAWIIAIGDELISGQRLDTNSQWISQRLEQLGIEVTRHYCIGDDIEVGHSVFSQALREANFVVSTGGIGPTKDDLTRQVIANAAEVELEFDSATELHIKKIFASYGREMPDNNRIQAYFPRGSVIIPNAEGTAPGIDLTVGNCRLFALPGVPYEMKQMWEDHIELALVKSSGQKKLIRHHAVHCFGAGESQIEQMLQGMTNRGHDPRIGITASQATVTLRITAAGQDEAECGRSIEGAVDRIHTLLGNLVFGANGDQLEDVIVKQLGLRGQTLALVDYAFGGTVANLLHDADPLRKALVGATVALPESVTSRDDLANLASRIRTDSNADFGLAISSLYESQQQKMYDLAIVSESDCLVNEMKFAGHSGLRKSRTAKQILNAFRLYLVGSV